MGKSFIEEQLEKLRKKQKWKPESLPLPLDKPLEEIILQQSPNEEDIDRESEEVELYKYNFNERNLKLPYQ